MLNPEQKLASEHKEGPLLIIAGAGSGKTTVMKERICNLLHDGVSPRNVLAVTFTNKAAKELKDRVGKVNPLGYGMQISTFHSFCVKVLREELPKELFILDTYASEHLISQIIKRHKYSLKAKASKNLISALKNEMMTTEEWIDGINTNPYIDWKKVNQITAPLYKQQREELHAIFKEYNEVLKSKNQFDFDDLMTKVVGLFLENPNILEKYQERFKYLIIDEYQDTNRTQYVLTKLLASKYRNLAVVGDDSQSIYRFRGADIQNILDFQRDYPEAKVIKLEHNYRSVKSILDVSNALISRNRRQLKKTLRTTKEGDQKVKLFHMREELDIGEYIAEVIEEKLAAGASYDDFAVLYRANAQSLPIEVSLRAKGIPFTISGGLEFYSREEIQDLIAHLRLINDTNDFDAFSRAFRKPKRRLAEKTLARILTYSYDKPLLEVLEKADEIERIQKVAKEELVGFVKMIRDLNEKKQEVGVIDMIEVILEETGYIQKFLRKAYDKDQAREKEENITIWLSTLRSQEENTGQTVMLSDILEEVTLGASGGVEGEEGINLMTIHASKGLEFKHVFLIGMGKSIFPAFYIRDEEDIEEERRLAYVACTRAMDELHLFRPRRRLKKDGGISEIDVSPFIEEMNRDELEEFHF